jgi:hypothetical protein
MPDPGFGGESRDAGFAERMASTDEQRRREEDPFTAAFIRDLPERIVVRRPS